jgi:anti-sigma factor RsiW
MSPLTHTIPAEWLMAYHDGELGAVRLAQVEAHLLECAECREELEALSRLSQALAADLPPAGDTANAEDFWRRVQSQLPALRRPAASPTAPPSLARHPGGASARQVVLRWLPGIGLLLLNGAVQVLGLGLTALMLLPSALAQAPAWAAALLPLASGATLGWLGWLAPANWSGWELFGFWLLVSAELAVLYLAWLGYELRHGPHITFGRALTGRGA